MRRAFTLVEVMVSLVVTGLVVSLTLAASQAGFDTESRLLRHREGAEREAALRALLSDAVRHQVEGLRGGEAVFALTHRQRPDGGAADSLHLTTTGVVPPLGTLAEWAVDVWLTGDSLQLWARPVASADSAPMPITASLPGVERFEVMVLGRGLGARWQRPWPDRDLAPDALSIDIVRRVGGSTRLLVRRALERAP